MTTTNARRWSDTRDYERLLDLSGLDSGRRVGSNRPSKQLACVRCHSQKLRCVRQYDKSTCDRCLLAKVDCHNRTPQRIGRPVDVRSHGARLYGERHRTAPGRDECEGETLQPSSSAQKRRRNSTYIATPLSEDLGHSSASTTSRNMDEASDAEALLAELPVSTGPFDLDSNWTWTPALSSAISRAAADHAEISTTAAPTSHLASASLLTTPSFEASANADPLMFDAADMAAMAAGADLSGTASQCPNDHETAPPLYLPTLDQIPQHDPVESLSKLHLKLYQCLALVRSIEVKKKAKIRSPSQDTGPIESNWSQQVFSTIEAFTRELDGYVKEMSKPGRTSENLAHLLPISNGDLPAVDEAQADAATGLTIVSCYMRLLQLLRVVVFIVEIYRDMDCPGSYVQISFGSFVSTENKALAARLLAQYVLHLMDGVSDVMDRVVAIQQPYVGAIADVRGVEVQLKQRIVALLR